MLQAFLIDLAGRPFRWGRVDCMLAVADWLLVAGRNRDPAETFRGTYDDEAGCIRALRAAGGVLRIARSAAAEMCLDRVEPSAAPAGAIAVVRFGREGEREHHFGAIRAPSGRWAIKCNDGLVTLRNVRVIAAWKVI